MKYMGILALLALPIGMTLSSDRNSDSKSAGVFLEDFQPGSYVRVKPGVYDLEALGVVPPIDLAPGMFLNLTGCTVIAPHDYTGPVFRIDGSHQPQAYSGGAAGNIGTTLFGGSIRGHTPTFIGVELYSEAQLNAVTVCTLDKVAIFEPRIGIQFRTKNDGWVTGNTVLNCFVYIPQDYFINFDRSESFEDKLSVMSKNIIAFSRFEWSKETFIDAGINGITDLDNEIVHCTIWDPVPGAQQITITDKAQRTKITGGNITWREVVDLGQSTTYDGIPSSIIQRVSGL